MIAVFYRVSHAPSSSSPTARDDCEPYDFGDNLQEFICRRLDRVNPYEESKEYCLEQEKASRLHARLLEMLPEEGRAALVEYGEAVADAHYLEVMILAERAFLEGVRLVVRAVAEA